MLEIIEQFNRSKILFSFAKMRGIIAMFLVAVFVARSSGRNFFHRG